MSEHPQNDVPSSEAPIDESHTNDAASATSEGHVSGGQAFAGGAHAAADGASVVGADTADVMVPSEGVGAPGRAEDVAAAQAPAGEEPGHEDAGQEEFTQGEPPQVDRLGEQPEGEEPAAEDAAQEEPTWRRFDLRTERDAALAAAQEAVAAGECIVLPTDTVYGIGANAFSAAAVQRLLDAKHRGRDMPPPVLISEPALLEALGSEVESHALRLAEECWPGALTLIVTMQPSLRVDLGETRGTIALRVPDHDDTRDLLRRTGPLAVSSANVSGRPASTTIDAAIEMLGNSVSVYLDAGPTPGETPSTMVDFVSTAFGKVVRQGALSIERIHEVAPFVEELVVAPTTTEAASTEDAPTQDAPGDGAAVDDAPGNDAAVNDAAVNAAVVEGVAGGGAAAATTAADTSVNGGVGVPPVPDDDSDIDMLGHQFDTTPVGTENQVRGGAASTAEIPAGEALTSEAADQVTPMVADAGEGGAPSDSGRGWPGGVHDSASGPHETDHDEHAEGDRTVG